MLKEKICFVYAVEVNSKVSLNAMLYGEDGNISSRNNWMFDILTLDLFESVLVQFIKNRKDIGKCIIALPGNINKGSFETANFFKVNGKHFEDLVSSYGVDVMMVNDLDTALMGHIMRLKEASNISAVYFTDSFKPRAEFMSSDQSSSHTFRMPCAIHHLFPEANLTNLMNGKKKERLEVLIDIVKTIASMTLPKTLIVYSEHLIQSDLDDVLNKIKNHGELDVLKKIVVVNELATDLENGLRIIASECSNNQYTMKQAI